MRVPHTVAGGRNAGAGAWVRAAGCHTASEDQGDSKRLPLRRADLHRSKPIELAEALPQTGEQRGAVDEGQLTRPQADGADGARSHDHCAADEKAAQPPVSSKDQWRGHRCDCCPKEEARNRQRGQGLRCARLLCS